MALFSMIFVLSAAQSMAVAPAQVMTESETNVAAMSYMRDTGVSLETAKQRLQIESELPPYIAELRERYRDRVAFISVESQPDQHLVVGLTGIKMQPSQRINVGASMIRVEFEEGYPYREAEFNEVMKTATAKVTALIPDATSVDGFPELNLIKVGVQGTDKEKYLPAIKEVEQATGLKVELVLGELPFRNSAYTRGGAILQSNGSTCTSGLAVRHKVTKEKGLITAAHCEDNLMYSNYSQTVGGPQVLFPLIFKDGMFDGSHDVQWHSVPAGSSPLQEVFAEGQGEYQGKALLLIYGGLTLNAKACFRGARSGFSCGTVVSINHTPLGTCGLVTCASTWARIEGADLACGAGDSGAAVFNIGSGYGIVKSALNKNDSPLKGDCSAVTVMPFGKVADLNLGPL